MNLVLEQFDAIVTNVANSYRLQEECDVLSLVLSKYPNDVNLSEPRGPNDDMPRFVDIIMRYMCDIYICDL